MDRGQNVTQGSKKSSICQFCGKMFPNKSLLKAHLPKHNDYRPHKCSECGKLFKRKETWSKHIKVVHSAERKFQCVTCDKAFKTKSYLSAHEINVHQSRTHVTCRYCDKPFKTKKYMHDHVQLVHTKKRERKYACSSCSLAFISPKDLRRHAMVHSGIKEHQCNICHKCYSRTEYLKVHMKTHGKLTTEEVISYIKEISATTI